MKNKKIFATAVLGAFVLTAFSSVASANSLNLDLGISGNVKSEARDNDKEKKEDKKVKMSAKAEAKASLDREDNDDKKDEKKDLPPGIEKKIDKLNTNPRGGILGWFKHWFGQGTTIPKKVVKDFPSIKNISVVSSTTSMIVYWNTNESTTGEVRFGTSSPLATSTSSVVVDALMATSHTVTLTGLTADTVYYFSIKATDADGNVKTSEIKQFRTKAVVTADVVSPKILFSAGVGTSSTTAHILWMTDERSDSRVWVGGTTPVDVTTSATVSASGLLYVHDMLVSGFSANTTYHFAVRSADASGNLSVSSTGSFTTK